MAHYHPTQAVPCRVLEGKGQHGQGFAPSRWGAERVNRPGWDSAAAKQAASKSARSLLTLSEETEARASSWAWVSSTSRARGGLQGRAG